MDLEHHGDSSFVGASGDIGVKMCDIYCHLTLYHSSSQEVLFPVMPFFHVPVFIANDAINEDLNYSFLEGVASLPGLDVTKELLSVSHCRAERPATVERRS